MRATKDESGDNGPADKEQERSPKELFSPPKEINAKYYHIHEGTDTLYDATENADHTWTVFNAEGESQAFSSEEFHMNYKAYQDPEQTDILKTGDPLLGSEEGGRLDSDEEAIREVNVEDIPDLDTAKATIRALQDQLTKQQGLQPGLVPQSLIEQKLSSSAEKLITGLAALGAGVYKGVSKVVENTKDKLTAWQGAQRLYEVQGHLNAAHNHLDIIKTDPAFQKEMTAIETGVKSNEDVRSTLFERFTSDDLEIQNSKFNLAYHGLLSEMSDLSKFDYETAQDKINLREKTQGKAATELQQKVEGFLGREELDVLPDANNENIRINIENMVKQIQEFIKRLAQRVMPQQQEQGVIEMAPSN